MGGRYGAAMAEVVLVHGAFHELWGPARLAFRWAPPLLDGMWAAGLDLRAVGLEPMRERMAVAFWGDLFRPEPLPREQVLAAAAEGGGTEPGAGLAGVVDHLGESGSGALDAVGKALAAETQRRSMELLLTYFTDPAVRERVHGRVARHLGPETKVVIAHSMGTVIAYEALCAHPELQIARFVTLGSPLGTPGLVLDQLQPPPVDGRGVWPTCVEGWTNVAAEGDLATLAAPELAGVFGDRVRDEYVFNGRHPHDIEPYLTARETGAAVVEALGLPTRARSEDA